MLSDEEKAIEELKNKKADYFMISNLMSKTLLNLIDKQSKEIEEYKKQIDLDNECEIALNSKVMDLEKEIEELKNADLTTVYLNGVYDGEKKVEDKIKAMLENEIINISGFECVAKGDVQSLLEKE